MARLDGISVRKDITRLRNSESIVKKNVRHVILGERSPQTFATLKN